MRKISLFGVCLWVLLNLLNAGAYLADPEIQFYKEIVAVKAQFIPDDQAEEKNITSIYVEVENRSAYNLRVEPHFDSYLQTGDKRYYRRGVKSTRQFASGFIAPGGRRQGFIYFPPLETGSPTANFYLFINKFKLYDGITPPFNLKWQFVPVKDYNPTLKKLAAEAGESAVESRTGDQLDYAAQYLAAGSQGNKDLSGVKIDMPSKAGRGEKIPVHAYMPTGIEGSSVTMVVGVASSLILQKSKDGVFSGEYRIPETFMPGNYVATFYVRSLDNQENTFQKILEVAP